MSKLIDEANKCLVDSNLVVQLGIEQESRFRSDNYGLQYDSGDAVRAVFQMIEGNKIIAQHPLWKTFMDLIQDEFGGRFMRKTGLTCIIHEA